MKKLMLLIVFVFALSINAFAVTYFEEEAVLNGMCSVADLQNPSVVKAVGFWAYGQYSDGSLAYVKDNGSSYVQIRAFVIGYTSANQHSGQFNGTEVGTQTDIIKCPQKVLKDAQGNYTITLPWHYAGRAYNYMIPKNLLRIGTNTLIVNIEGQSRTLRLTVE